MKAAPILDALDAVAQRWTRQIKAEEKSFNARRYRSTVWAKSERTSLKEICYDNMEEAWKRASDNGRLPTHWRQIFYVMRPLCEQDPDSDRPLRDQTFKQILESYLADYGPGWDVLRGARGVFKEPHAASDDHGLGMSTLNVRDYLRTPALSSRVSPVPTRFPTRGARNRIAAALICEKEGFDELLQAELIPERYDLALISTKGISAHAARDLAAGLDVPCFTLHDFDKNGFTMAAGFPFATNIGLRMADTEEWQLPAEEQIHKNPRKAYANLRANGATAEEAAFIATRGKRVELNMFTGPQFIEFVEGKLDEHGVQKVVPDDETLRAAWDRVHVGRHVNAVIDQIYAGHDVKPLDGIPQMPDDLDEEIRDALDGDPTISWDEALWEIAAALEN